MNNAELALVSPYDDFWSARMKGLELFVEERSEDFEWSIYDGFDLIGRGRCSDFEEAKKAAVAALASMETARDAGAELDSIAEARQALLREATLLGLDSDPRIAAALADADKHIMGALGAWNARHTHRETAR